MQEKLISEVEKAKSALYRVKIIKRPFMGKNVDDNKDAFNSIFGSKAFQVVVPAVSRRTRTHVTGLSPSEERWLEVELGYKEGFLKATNSEFWGNYRIKISYQDTMLDTSLPKDYMDWKVLSVSERVADSKAARNLPWADFLMVNEEVEAEHYNTIYETEAEAYKIWSELSIKECVDFTKVYAGGKYKISHGHTPDQVRAIVAQAMKENPERFLSILKDPTYKTNVFIQDAIIAGALSTSNRKYYIAGEVEPIGHSLEETIMYFNDPQNQAVKLNIKSKLEVPTKKFTQTKNNNRE